MSTKYLFLIFICFLAFSSCKKNTTITTDARSSKLKFKDFDYTYLAAKGRINYNDGEQLQKATIDIRARKDSAIWMSLRTNTGIEGARFLITKDTALMLDRLNKGYRKYSFEELSDRLKVDVDFSLFESILLGNVLKKYRKRMKSSKSDDFFILKRSDERFAVELFISRKLNKLQKAVTIDNVNQNTLTVAYDDFKPVNEDTFPFMFEASLINKSGSKKAPNLDFSIKYSKVNLPEKPLKLPFRISSKYKKLTD
eukprot:TRINITY_DN55_c0_g1_i1.p1 TRINITY_DN55_c0_g1~~TRINITY_DN55_c0_g1_i1.p1  ORF type:complete len:254 (+),score=-47.95 TRINITY_DN55_c0_g1_i1:72-833(+)